ncbi:hypothetical protein NIES2100_13220 [Calothrix sp. NIES-2100]|nr:hypothetical protein NIES2100_13220 [Calothrix sp. NIES-2100]
MFYVSPIRFKKNQQVVSLFYYAKQDKSEKLSSEAY